MKRYTHQELDTEVFSIAGHYKVLEEGKMTFGKREFFYVMGGAKVSPRPDHNIIRYLRKALISDHHVAFCLSFPHICPLVSLTVQALLFYDRVNRLLIGQSFFDMGAKP